MSRRITAFAIFLMLATILFLRETPVVFVGVATLVAAAGVSGVRLDKRRERRWTIAVGVACVIWVAIRAVMVEGFSVTLVAEALLLVLATDLCRLPEAELLPRSFPAMSLVTLVAAMQQRVTFENLSWFALLGMGVVLALTFLAVQQRVAGSGRFASRRLAASMAVVAFAAFASFKTSEAWGDQLSEIENRVDAFLSNFVSDSIPRLYPRTGTLNSIRNEKLSDPTAVAVRVYSRKKPGYLTGRVFDNFNARTLFWRLMGPQYREGKGLDRLEVVVPDKGSGIRVPQGQRIYRLTREQPSRRFQIYEIENTSGRGEMVFMPQGTQYVAGYGRSLRVDDHGVIHFGLNCESKYMAYADANAKASGPGVIREVLLDVPDSVRDGFAPLVQKVVPEGATFDETVDAIKQYFATDFTYSNQTNPDRVPWRRFLQHFVTTGKEGHCELFATSAVMMLRMKGIPARYVTGYVVEHKDPYDNDYWAALNRDCHAWAEAWNEQQGRWEIVETTPGMNYATADSSGGGDGSDLEIDESAEDVSGASAGSMSSQKWVRIVQWTGLTIASVFLGLTLWRFSSGPGKPAVANPAILRLDRQLSRQGIERQSGETLHEFADRIEQLQASKLSETTRAEAARFYRQYGDLLYAGKNPELASLVQPAV